MYLDGLDELDQKIIQLLIENARISYSDIGEETGISRVAVKAQYPGFGEKRRNRRIYNNNKSSKNQWCCIMLF